VPEETWVRPLATLGRGLGGIQLLDHLRHRRGRGQPLVDSPPAVDPHPDEEYRQLAPVSVGDSNLCAHERGCCAPVPPLSATSESYDGTHVERLRLIRALVDGAGLTIARVRRVTQTLDNPPKTWHDMLGTAQGVLCGPPDEDLETTSADALLRRLG